MAVSKSPDAFRTISEVADWLEVQAHVLRFWESKFTQVKPVKRAGGRRYYRPADMMLLGGIKQLLHEDGMTIKGVQKMLREKGVAHVSSFSRPLDSDLIDAEENAVPDSAVVEVRSHAAEAVDEAVEDAEFVPETAPEPAVADTAPAAPAPEEEPAPAAQPEDIPDSPRLPAFLHREPPPAADPEPPATPRPRIVDAPDPAADDEVMAEPGLLARLAALHSLSAAQRGAIAPVAAELRGWITRVGGAQAS